MTSFHILLIVAAATALVLAAVALIVDGLRIARETQTLGPTPDGAEADAPIPAARLQFGLSRPAQARLVETRPAEARPVAATRPQALARALTVATPAAEAPAIEAPETLHTPLEPFPASEHIEG